MANSSAGIGIGTDAQEPRLHLRQRQYLAGQRIDPRHHGRRRAGRGEEPDPDAHLENRQRLGQGRDLGQRRCPGQDLPSPPCHDVLPPPALPAMAAWRPRLGQGFRAGRFTWGVLRPR
ncbi:hypothetical protein GCM10011504_35670 [Siccirubricoccus deserti]|nr:hypothetical protein GCM10011504_35670 [Siccirubricoccus deserti]